MLVFSILVIYSKVPYQNIASITPDLCGERCRVSEYIAQFTARNWEQCMWPHSWPHLKAHYRHFLRLFILEIKGVRVNFDSREQEYSLVLPPPLLFPLFPSSSPLSLPSPFLIQDGREPFPPLLLSTPFTY